EAEFTIVDLEQRLCARHIRLHHAETAGKVGPETAAALPSHRYPDDRVHHERRDVAAVDEIDAVVVRLKELRRICEVGLPAEDTRAHPADGCAVGEVFPSAGAAAEPRADVWRKQPVRVRCTRR